LWLSQSRLQQSDEAACTTISHVWPGGQCLAPMGSGGPLFGCHRGGCWSSTPQAERPRQPPEDLRSHLKASRQDSRRHASRYGGKATIPSAYSGRRSSSQTGEQQAGVMLVPNGVTRLVPSHRITGHGHRLHCVSYPGEAGGSQGFFLEAKVTCGCSSWD